MTDIRHDSNEEYIADSLRQSEIKVAKGEMKYYTANEIKANLVALIDKEKGSQRGSLHKYANPDLIPLEKHAHTIHVLKKYGKKK